MNNEQYQPLPVKEKKPKVGDGKAVFKTATSAARAAKEFKEDAWKHELGAKHAAEQAMNDARRVRLTLQAGAVLLGLLTLINTILLFLR